MKDLTEAAVRLGLALYRKTVLEGVAFYQIYDLVFDDSDTQSPKSLFLRTFASRENFWSIQEEAARILDGSGLATSQRRQVIGSAVSDYSLKITPLGKAIYSLAHLQSDVSSNDIDQISIEDLAKVLSNEDDASEINFGLKNLDLSLDSLNLSNFQRSTVNSYVVMLSAICDMPERDAKLFWIILNRLNQFAGVASLIVAIIALKLGR